MAVLALVVYRRAALDDLLKPGGIEYLVPARRPPYLFRERQHRPAVPVRHADQAGPRFVIERQRFALGCLRPLQKFLEAGLVMRLERQDARPREERGVKLERRVLGGGADQDDGAILHDRQEAVLLRPVEPVDLVDEKQRLAPRHAPGARRFEYLLKIRNAGEDCRNLLECETCLA